MVWSVTVAGQTPKPSPADVKGLKKAESEITQSGCLVADQVVEKGNKEMSLSITAFVQSTNQSKFDTVCTKAAKSEEGCDNCQIGD